MKKLLVFAIAILGFTAVSFGQNTATANATVNAKLIRALTLANSRALEFGTVTGGLTEGTIQVSGAATAVVTVANGVKQYTTGNTPTSATFTITGEPLYAVTVSLPTLPYVITSTTPAVANTPNGTTESMSVTLFTTDFTAGSAPYSGPIDVTGTSVFHVGATLTVKAAQSSGTYTAATGFPVTVNYN